MKLDETDLKILRLLQNDAELTNKQMAYVLHKSLGTIHERIRRLKAEGYIKKTVAILDRAKIECGLIAFCHVNLSGHDAATLKGFEQEAIKLPEVMECFQLSGDSDFILRIATKDMEAYTSFYRNKLAELPNIITMQSSFVLEELKSVTAYPIPQPANKK